MDRRTLLLPAAALALVGALVVAVLVFGSSPQSGANPPTRGDANTSEGIPDQRVVDPSVCASPLGPGAASRERVFHASYTQQREVLGITIVANDDVSARALDVAEDTIRDMFSTNDLEDALAGQGAYVIVASDSQGILDIPEFRCLREQGERFDHVCGVADHADFPVATVNELDLLGARGGPCGGENILYHELGHLVQGWAISPTDAIDIRLLYQDALDAGKYEGAYAATNSNEYFAEATQAYFDRGLSGETRDWLGDYDPGVFAMLESIYGARD